MSARNTRRRIFHLVSVNPAVSYPGNSRAEPARANSCRGTACRALSSPASHLFRTLATVWILALYVSPVSANHQESQNASLVYAALAKVPGKAQVKPNPLEHDPEAVVAGGKLFAEHCSECHGMKAEGTKRGPSLLREPVRQATPGALFWILSNGVIRRGMPDWSKLPEPERWQLVRFLKSLGATQQTHNPANPKP